MFGSPFGLPSFIIHYINRILNRQGRPRFNEGFLTAPDGAVMIKYRTILSRGVADSLARRARAKPGRCEMEARKIEEHNLETFDDLDYNVFTGQKWDELGKSHDKNIVVHWPDGHVTRGLDVHIKDLKAMFVYAPDTRIKEHPIKIAEDEWTTVMGIMEGTFTRPMPTSGGEAIQPTGKAFKLPMATIGRWKDGVMVEEWLFWDNLAFMKQIGLAQ